MSTPILNPNSSSPINANPNFTSSPSQLHFELGQILRQHDPNATRLYDFLNHVQVFFYNSTEFYWENNPRIKGNLFAYEKQKIINNQLYQSFAFAVINDEQQHFIQEITLDMSEYADKQRLFYELIRNEKHEVFSLHFLHENECQRLHAFINRSIQLRQNVKQSVTTVTNERQLAPPNRQEVSAHVDRQQTPVIV
jgi:hypothetical protein